MFKKYYQFVILIPLLLLLLPACQQFIDMEPVKVTKYSPSEEALSYSGNGAGKSVSVRVSFSKTMNKKSVEKAFSYEEDGNKIDGSFEWKRNNSEFTFHPRKECLPGKTYTFALPTSAEDENGNDLKDGLSHSFHLGNDTSRPTVIKEECSPAAGSNLGLAQLREPIIIQFSEPMDKQYPYNHFSITEIEGTLEWLDGNNNVIDQFSSVSSSRLRFTPLTDYVKQKYYTVSIGTTFTDEAHNSLLEAYSFQFYVSNEFLEPAVVSAVTTSAVTLDTALPANPGIEKDDQYTITFSRDMDRELTENAISIVPDVPKKFTWTSNTELNVEFTENLAAGEKYTLTISDTAKDTLHNLLDRNYEYKLIIDGPFSAPPALTAVDLTYHISTVVEIINGPEVDYDIVYIDVPLTWDPSGDIVYFEFNFSACDEINIISLIDSISFSNITAGGTTLDIVEFSNPAPSVYKVGCQINGYNQKPGDPNEIILMKVAGDGANVRDIRDNYMVDTLERWLIFRIL